MNAAVASAGTLAWALLFVTGCSASLFETDKCSPTYGNLTTRGCLDKDNFSGLPELDLSLYCAGRVDINVTELPNQCQEAPVLALFYNCFADGQGLLGDGQSPPNGELLDEAISFLYSSIKENKKLLTNDEEWLGLTNRSLDACEARAAAGMSLRQEAVYAYLCLKWTWFSDCDRQQDENGTLDDFGARTRADFLCGDCPLSPGGPAMKAALESVTGRTLAGCSNGLYNGPDAQLRYDAAIDKITCMLQDFQTGINLNHSQLKAAIVAELTGANSEGAELLLDVAEKCEDKAKTEDFVKCWADIGVFDCIYHQANQVAADFPNNCMISTKDWA